MGHKKEHKHKVSRRTFLGAMRWAPLLYLPAPLHSAAFRSWSPETLEEQGPSFPLADFRLTPHYPAKSPLDDVLRYVPPGSDEFITEKYAAEIAQHLEEWGGEHALQSREFERAGKTPGPRARGRLAGSDAGENTAFGKWNYGYQEKILQWAAVGPRTLSRANASLPGAIYARGNSGISNLRNRDRRRTHL